MPELTTDPPPGLGLTGSDSEETDQELEQYRQMIMQFRNEIRRFRSTENTSAPVTTSETYLQSLTRYRMSVTSTEHVCAICLDVIKPGKLVMRCPCPCTQNVYHAASDDSTCPGLDTWLSRYDNRCPQCRTELPAAQRVHAGRTNPDRPPGIENSR